MKAPSDVDVLARWQRKTLERTNVCKLATIVAYNDATNRAVVALQQVAQHADGSIGTPRQIPGVPVAFWRVGGFLQKASPLPGDEVLLVIHDRALNKLLAAGEPRIPSDRMHDVNDAIAITFSVGRATDPMPPTAAGLQLGREDGTAGLAIDPAGATASLNATTTVRLGSAPVQPAVLGVALQSALTAFAATVGSAAGTWGLATADPASATFATTLATALTDLATDLATILSAKVVIE